jgi:2-dehydro-3-deoxyphosphogluconate aldolase / (4S)-4-hydroxy-2-oxoglutarate aldolase
MSLDLDAALAVCPVVAIVRERDAGRDLIEVVDAIVAGGIRAVEVTVDTPDWARVVEHFSGRSDLAVGAGTVQTEAELEALHAAGGRFSVSPHVDASLIEAALRLGLEPLPGAMTPTEVRLATVAGASHVKLFPAVAVGPDHLRALLGPFPGLRVVPTGGIGPGDVDAWFDGGATAVGLGGSLLAGTVADIEKRTRQLTEALAVRGEGE